MFMTSVFRHGKDAPAPASASTGVSSSADVISHDELVSAIAAKKVTVIDVREAKEFSAGAIKGAINLPLSTFDLGGVSREKPIVLYCVSGGRALMAQQAMRAAGFDNVLVYRPGIGNWRLQGGKVA